LEVALLFLEKVTTLEALYNIQLQEGNGENII